MQAATPIAVAAGLERWRRRPWHRRRSPRLVQHRVADTNVSNETVNLNYDDTSGFALGAQYELADGWLWSVGGGFDTSPVSKGERSPNLPFDQQFRIATGVQYSVNDKITIGAAYEYMNAGDADLDAERGPLAGRIEGDYKSNDFHFFALNLSWRL